MHTIDPEIRDKAYQYFSQEALEFLQTIEEGLLNLQADHSVPQIHNLMRAAHSIKGGAASIGLPAIEHISHRLEDIFRALYGQDHEIDRDVEELLLQAYDCLRLPLVEQIQTGKHDGEAAIAKAEPILAVIAEFLGDSLGAEIELPTSAELGFDIAQVVFSTDVIQGLERLESVLEHPELEQVVGEIRAQAEVFSGIGELLNLPGFSEIAKFTILALDANPNEAVLVGQVAIANFREAYELVLAGDRTQGGAPNETLLMLVQNSQSSQAVVSKNLTSTESVQEPRAIIATPSALEQAFQSALAEEEDHADQAPNQFFEELPEDFNQSFGGLLEEPRDLTVEVSDRFFEELPEEITDSSQDFFEELPEASFFEIDQDLLDEVNTEFFSRPIAVSTQLDVQQNETVSSSEPEPDNSAEVSSNSIINPDHDNDDDASLIFEQLNQMYSDDTEDLEPINLTFNPPASDIASTQDSGLDFSILGGMFSDGEDEGDLEPLDMNAFILADEEDLIQSSDSFQDASRRESLIESESFQLTDSQPQADAQNQAQDDISLRIANLLKQGNPEVTTLVTAPSNEPVNQSALEVQTKAQVVPFKTETAVTTQPITPQMSEAIRVDLSRLERLNNLAGELVTQENSSSLQTQQLQGMLLNLQRRSESFEELTKKLQSWIDSSQKSEVSNQRAMTGSEKMSSSLSLLPDLATFDPLLMDSYSYIYTLVQESVEEIAQMGETIRDMDLLSMQTKNTQRKKQQTLKQLRNDLLWARMMPLNEILSRFPRMVRDLSMKYDKKVKLTISGGNTLVDKAMLEKLYDPLVHLIRNAFDHGTEPSHLRVQQGKPAEATIEVRAYHRGNQTFVEIRDDGRGIDSQKVRAAAIAKGVLTPSQQTSRDQVYDLLFSPSFSTAEKVSELSGRGVGLTAVREQITSLKGSVVIDSELGRGTVFTIRLPLTLTTAKLLVFSIGVNMMAIPVDTLLTIVTASDDQIQTIQGQQFYRYLDELIPLYPQSAFVHYYPLPKNSSEQIRSMSLPIADKVPLLIISAGNQYLALEVDQIFNEQELVIKPFGKAIAPPPYLYGCTILGDGSLVPVVDGSALVAQWLKPMATVVYSEPIAKPQLPTQAPLMLASKSDNVSNQASNETVNTESANTESDSHASTPAVATSISQSSATILVIDDSTTARQTLSETLVKYGYRVVEAFDGRDALDKIKQDPSIQAAFCDIEMPRMNGFEFLNQFRNDHPTSTMPIIMLTSRGGEKHRSLATLFGASGYLTKPYLEQELLIALQSRLDPQAKSVKVDSQSSIQTPVPTSAAESISEAVLSSSMGESSQAAKKDRTSRPNNLGVTTILVIDDSLTARQTLTMTLAKHGYRVVQAGDGREALEKIRQEPEIQAVFCDVEMPRMNGFEFLNQFRNDHPKSKLPIIMLTSRSSEKHRSLATLFGASGYLTKPYLEHELLKTLQSKLQPIAE
jgi:two-component system, chemotaxis family, sensor histidine kinase and response regulator PixL